MRKSKNCYFYDISVSPGDAPGAITLNVVWMETEFDAYKLSRCMYPSKYNRFWDTAIYLWKNRHFIIPLAFDAPVGGGFPSEYRHPVRCVKTRMVGLPDSEKNFDDMCNRLGTIPACGRQTGICCEAFGKHWIVSCLSIHETYCVTVIVAGASPGETKMWAAIRENGDFLHLRFE